MSQPTDISVLCSSPSPCAGTNSASPNSSAEQPSLTTSVSTIFTSIAPGLTRIVHQGDCDQRGSEELGDSASSKTEGWTLQTIVPDTVTIRHYHTLSAYPASRTCRLIGHRTQHVPHLERCAHWQEFHEGYEQERRRQMACSSGKHLCPPTFSPVEFWCRGVGLIGLAITYAQIVSIFIL
jgi:hypothetical protein